MAPAAPISTDTGTIRSSITPNINLWGVIALAAAWITILSFGFWLGADRILLSLDGRYFLTMVKSRGEFDFPWFSDSIDFLQGLGDQIPFRPEILPVFRIIAAFGFSNWAKVAGFGWLAFELIAAITFLTANMGLAFATGLAASAITIVCMLPLWNFGAVYTFVHISPHFSSLVAATIFTAGLYVRIGRSTVIADLARLTGLAIILLWFILASPTAIILPAPLLGMIAIVGLCAASNTMERWRKLFAIVSLLVFLGCGPIWYALSQVTTSAAYVFNVELQNSLANLGFASIIFHARDISLMGPFLVVSAAGGAIINSKSQNYILRYFGYAILTYLLSQLVFASLTITFDFWRGPAPIYFELFMIPLYSIFAWLFWEKIINWVAKYRLGLRKLPHYYPTYASVVILVIAVITGNRHPIKDIYLYPPHSTAITNYLGEHSRLRAEQPFTGRVATMTGMNLGRSIDWFDLVAKVDPVFLRFTGNDHREPGLRYFNIPSLFEYSPIVAAPFYATVTRLLGYPQDKQVRNVQVLRRVEPRVLTMLGVRYIISDAPISNKSAKLRVTLPLNDGAILYLYELSEPNLGDYSPIQLAIKDTATETIEQIADPQFDPTRQVVLNADPQTRVLTKATNAKLIFEGPRLHIMADSAGYSLLVLPLQYSHCLRLESSSQTLPQLFRANLVETAVLFEKHLDVRIELWTGPFIHPFCRFKDSEDDARLRMNKVPRQILGLPSPG